MEIKIENPLIIWEKELKDSTHIIEKINEFIGGKDE